MEHKAYIGIDIGKHGGICIMKPDKPIETKKIPLNKEGELDISIMYELLLNFAVIYDQDLLVGFEKLTPLHFASKSANWSLALQAGAIEALCLAMRIPYRAIPPKEWQHKIFEKLPPIRQESGSKDTKFMALIAVKALYPDLDVTGGGRKKTPHDGIVDSILICHYTKELTL